MNERRRKLVRVSRLLVQDLFWTEGSVMHVKCTKGLPADATFIGLTYDHMRDIYFFCYQSAEWEPMPDDQMLPEFDLQFTKFDVAPFLEEAERLIDAYSCYADNVDAGPEWLEQYRAFKALNGWPNDND